MKRAPQKTNTLKTDLLVLLPILIALCLISFVVLTKDYKTDFNEFSWFSETELEQIDSFEYAKGNCAIVMGIVAAIVLAIFEYLKPNHRKKFFEICDYKVCILCAVFFVMVIISSIASEYSDLAFTGGGYGQWQTMWVLLAYPVLFFYAYVFVDTERRAALLNYFFMGSTGLLALMGVLQTLGHNPLSWGWIQKIITSQSSVSGIAFKDGISEVVLTFNNPNYVGPYIALVLPIVVCFIATRVSANHTKTLLCRLAGVLISIGLCITLYGAASSAGMLSVIAGAFFAGVLLVSGLFPKKQTTEKTEDTNTEAAEDAVKKRPVRRYIIGGVAAVVVIAAGIAFSQTSFFENTLNKVLKGGEDTRNIASIVNNKDELDVTLRNDEEFTLAPQLDANNTVSFSARDKKDQPLELEWSAEKDGYIFKDERFAMITLRPVNFNVKETVYPGFRFNDVPNNISWVFMRVKNKWKYYTPFGKFTTLRKVESFGFKNHQNIANRRGFIWSRTIPLMKDYWFTGIGPNAFIIAFPNDDFVGSKRVGDNTTLVDKPHNTFLQMYIQIGGLSAIAYEGLWILYMINGLILFWRRKFTTNIEKTGLGLYVGIFSFAIASLTNDTVIGTQIIYWILLGVGYAVNRIIKKQDAKQGGKSSARFE